MNKMETGRHMSGFWFLLDEQKRNGFSEESNNREVIYRDWGTFDKLQSTV